MYTPATMSQKNTTEVVSKKPAPKVVSERVGLSDLAELCASVGHLLNQAGTSENDDEMLKVMNSLELTIPQAMTLKLLHEGGVHSVGDIAKRTGLSKPATSHLVDRLVRMGLVERTEDPNDRRQKQIDVSQKGENLFRQMKEKHHGCMINGLAALSDATRLQLQKLFMTIKQELSNHSKKI